MQQRENRETLPNSANITNILSQMPKLKSLGVGVNKQLIDCKQTLNYILTAVLS